VRLRKPFFWLTWFAACALGFSAHYAPLDAGLCVGMGYVLGHIGAKADAARAERLTKTD
jgi:4-hydroxybenzoate polyprenyltransferase